MLAQRLRRNGEWQMRVIRKKDRTIAIASGAFRRSVGASDDVTGADSIWMAQVEMAPAAISNPHHHGETETCLYIVEGDARFLSGERLDQVLDAGPGDFVWVPPDEVHVERNLSDSAPVRMVVARAPRDTTVDVPAPDGWGGDQA